LILAAGKDHPETVKKLLELGGNPDEVDHEGTTALMEATYSGAEDVVRILLESGADPQLKDSEGSSAIDIAQQEGHKKLLELLKN